MLFRIWLVVQLSILLLLGCREASDVVVTQHLENGSHPLDAFEERNDDPVAAAQDRFQRRLSADGTVPDRALLNASNQRDVVLSTSGGFPQGMAPQVWTWLGPGNIGGRLRPIVIHPTDPEIIYVGSASGGIWKTNNGGQGWFPLDDFLPSLAIADLVMHPNDPDTLYAGSGEGFFEAPEGTSNTAFVRGAGIFVSTDAGSTWNQLASTDNPDFYFVNRLTFDPTDTNTMLAATLTGIWRTTDGGQSWSLRQEFEAMDVKFDPNNPLNVVAGGHHIEGGPYYSNDAGVTWKQATGAHGDRQEFGWAPSQPGTVYAAVAEGGRIKVWRSTDNGQSYSLQTNSDGIFTLEAYTGTIWVDPTDASFLIVGGQRMFNSTDGGVNLEQRFNGMHPDMHRVVPHPDFDGTDNKTVFFATDGGIYRTDDVYGSSAFDLNNNLGVTQFYGGAINPTTGDIVGGTQDNGTLFYSGDPQDWFHLFGGDGGYGAADPTDPDYFYGEVQRALIHRSSDGGQSSQFIYNGPNPIEDAGSASTVNFIPFFLLDPNEPNRMLVACERMWRSNNVKDVEPDWFPIKESIEPPGGAPPPGEKEVPQSHYNPNSPFNLSTIAIAEGSSDVIWAAHNNGELYFSVNGTDATPVWTRVDNNGVGLPNRWISTVVIDRNDHNHVYIAFMGWESDNLWETTDSGLNWTEITGAGANSIPQAPISALAVHRIFPGRLFVGTDVGVFTSDDNGQNWMTQSEGPGNAPVEQLLWKNDNELLAVTHGRGMFLAEFPEILLGDVNLDGIVNLLDVAPFVDRISSGTYQPEADINQDSAVDLEDVDPFVLLLSGE